MKKLLSLSALLFALLFSAPSQAAGSAVNAMTASGAIVGTQLVWCPIAATSDLKCTFTQIDTFINAQFSGDITVTPGGVATLKSTGPGATGPLGSTTTSPSVTIDAQGRVTGLSSNNIAFPVSSVTGGVGITVSPTTGAVVVSAAVTARNNTATTDTITSADKGSLVTESNASSVAVGITTAGFVSTDYFTVKNFGAGVATYTPSSGTIDGAGTLACKQNQSADLYFDGTNYKTLANTCGQTITVASGAKALATGAIGSAACTSAQTDTATGAASTDVLTASFNGDPTAVTGYVPLTTGMLTIIAYPTTNTANFKVCNNTSSSITPGAITLNWRVVR